MPKVLIDITDEQYKDLIRLIKKCADAEEMVLTSTEMYNVAGLFLTTIEKGVALDNLTNGEVFVTMNPNVEVLNDTEYSVYLNYGDNIVSFDRNWWSRKWGE